MSGLAGNDSAAGRQVRKSGHHRGEREPALSGHQAGEHRALPALHRSRARRGRTDGSGDGGGGSGNHPRRNGGFRSDLRVPVEVQHPARRGALQPVRPQAGQRRPGRRGPLSRSRLRAAHGADELPDLRRQARLRSREGAGPGQCTGSRRAPARRLSRRQGKGLPRRRRQQQARRRTTARQRRVARTGELQERVRPDQGRLAAHRGGRPEAVGTGHSAATREPAQGLAHEEGCRRPARSTLHAPGDQPAERVSLGGRRRQVPARLHRGQADPESGKGGGLHRLRPDLRHQLPALDPPGAAEEDELGEPADAVHAGAALRRIRRRELRRIELPRGHQGLVQQRRVPGGGLAVRTRDVEPREVRLRHPGDGAHARRVLPDRHQDDHGPAGGHLPAGRGVRFRLHARRLGRAARGQTCSRESTPTSR